MLLPGRGPLQGAMVGMHSSTHLVLASLQRQAQHIRLQCGRVSEAVPGYWEVAHVCPPSDSSASTMCVRYDLVLRE